MYGKETLKNKIEITEETVECPVKNCKKKVPRQKEKFKKEEKFKCSLHNIYISPTTFEYENELDNLLWKTENDIDLLNRIKGVKRESRIARDNSEDALTWNVFRFFEKHNLIGEFLKKYQIDCSTINPEIIYWLYSQLQKGLWDMLEKGRKEFEFVPERGSEPDIIVLGKKELIIIEAKLSASNETIPTKDYVKEKYVSGGDKWWKKMFSTDFDTISSIEKKYELARFWLIGTWIAEKLDVRFYLLSLVLDRKDKDLESNFKRYIKENQNRKFKRITWEQIYKFILSKDISQKDKEIILKYFKNKTLGYDEKRNLQPAFSI